MPARFSSVLISIVVLGALSAMPALAQRGDSVCDSAIGAIDGKLGIARIAKGRAKVNFIKGADSESQGCPAATAACRDTAYLVAGDVVLTQASETTDFVCASYVNAKGWETTGWLPADALEVLTAPPVRGTASWLGVWRRTEAVIKIMPAKGGGVSIDGSATYGAGDPGRVARGGVNMGEIGGEANPADDRLVVAEGGARTLATAPAGTCAAVMRRVAHYLLVEDNGSCGGNNVRFTGIYVRR